MATETHTYRRRTLEVTLRITVDEFVPNDSDRTEKFYKFFWEDNHCIENELANFHERLKINDEGNYCTSCSNAEVTMLPLGVDEGIDLTTLTESPDHE